MDNIEHRGSNRLARRAAHADDTAPLRADGLPAQRLRLARNDPVVGHAHAATLDQQARFQQLQELGCVVCRVFFKAWRAPDISHLLDGGVRIGHEATIPECEWHHRGVPPCDCTDLDARRHLGPSRAHGSKPYETAFGTDAELLEMTEALITKLAAMKQSPTTRRKQPEQPIVASDWTVAGDIAARTKVMSIAHRVATKAGDGKSGDVDGVRWMRLADFQEACSDG